MTKPSTTRPTSAMKALMPTASPGSTVLRSAISGTRCVRNPTWLISTKANGAEMLQKAQCLSGASVLWLIGGRLGRERPAAHEQRHRRAGDDDADHHQQPLRRRRNPGRE